MRTPSQTRRRDAVVDEIGLGFCGTGGPLLAIVGLAGGAGATTIALLIAAVSARESADPVMVCDTAGIGADLAAYAGVHAPQSLAGAARMISAGRRPRPLFATGPHGVRVIASRPEPDCEVDEPGVGRLLGDARAAHALTVVDCGSQARPVERFALSTASHVVWVLPATAGGLRRARRRLATMTAFLPGAEIVVARHDPIGRTAPLADLADLADERGAPLVLMPHLGDLAELELDDVIDQADVALQALAVVLHR